MLLLFLGFGDDPDLTRSLGSVPVSMVLVTFKEEGASVRVVMGHAVEEVEVLQEADEETAERLRTAFLPQNSPSLDPDELKTRKGTVLRWLQQNRVPVEEDGDELRVAGVLTITAPFGPEDCCSSNQIILDRIQKLIQIQPLSSETDPKPPETDPGATRTSRLVPDSLE